MNSRIAVLGAGANGCCVAADLVRAGHEVVLIDQWPAHVETMRRDGLQIQLPDETIHVSVDAYHLCDIAAMNRVYDVVLLATKAYDTRWSCELIKPHLAEDGLIVGLQNAMTAEDIATVVGPARTLGCVVELSSEIFTPGLVKRNTPPARTWFGIGSFDPASAGRTGELEALLACIGRVSISSDILSAKWMKLVLNAMCLGPVSLTGLTIYEAVRIPRLRELMITIGTEALAAGQSQGYRIEPIFGLTAEDLAGTNQLLELLLDKVSGDIGPAARDCVLQDHLKGRQSEVDSINGLVVETCAQLGRAAPANAAIVEMTKRFRAGGLVLDPSNIDLAKALAAV
jgi:2-dehydropantoate 2-reductase